MTNFGVRWYDCEITEEISDEVPEPDWSKVPEQRRALVRQRWELSRLKIVVTKVKLWGPQIPFFRRQYPKVAVAICDRDECTNACLWDELWCPECQGLDDDAAARFPYPTDNNL